MGFNKSELAFEDVKLAFDRALSSPKGIKIACETKGLATRLRHRMNYYRSQHRTDGASPYDTLTISVEKESVVIRRLVDTLQIKDL